MHVGLPAPGDKGRPHTRFDARREVVDLTGLARYLRDRVQYAGVLP